MITKNALRAIQVLLIASCSSPAQDSSARVDSVASGVELRYRNIQALCASTKTTQTRYGNARKVPLRELMKQEIEDVFHGPWRVEVGTISIRPANRLVNLFASLGGMMTVDPGNYSVEFLIARADTGETLATGRFEARPTVMSLLTANPFGKEGAIRKNFLKQTRALRTYWLAKQSACGFDK